MSKLTELKAAHAKMGAEIEKLESEPAPEPRGVWQPEKGETYYFVSNTGQVHGVFFVSDLIDHSILKYHNVYQTQIQAEKASFLTRQSNRIIQACINFDPDFVPDWTDGSWKYSVRYSHRTNHWEVCSVQKMDSRPAYVSTNTIAQSMRDMFNDEDEA